MKNYEMKNIVKRQLQYWGGEEPESTIIDKAWDIAVERTSNCFRKICNKYYYDGNIDLYHSSQYAVFLYYLSNTIYKTGLEDASVTRRCCDILYSMIRMHSAVDLYYEVELPNVFMMDHPLGSVMGRATYGERFSFSQGCTVGNNKGVYPCIGENVIMYANSSIIGNSNIGSNVLIGFGAYIKDTDIPDGSMVFGKSPDLIIKNDKLTLIKETIKSTFY